MRSIFKIINSRTTLSAYSQHLKIKITSNYRGKKKEILYIITNKEQKKGEKNEKWTVLCKIILKKTKDTTL